MYCTIHNRRYRHYVCHVSIPIVAFVLSLLPATVGFAASPEDVLGKVRDSYLQLGNMHVKVNTVTLTMSSGREGPAQNGRFEYWSDGEKRYRIESRFQGRVPQELIDWSVAYDGSRYQQLEKQTSLLTYGKKRQNVLPLIPPNALFNPVMFLLSPQEASQAVRLDIAEIRDDARWKALCARATVASNGNGETVVTLRTPGEETSARDTATTTITMCSQEGLTHLPRIIEYPPDKHGIVTRVIIDDYQSVQIKGYQRSLPKTTRVLAIQDGKVVCSYHATIEALDVGMPVPPGIFTLDASKANTVYDEDVQVFIKTLGGFRLPEEALLSPTSPLKPAIAAMTTPSTGRSNEIGQIAHEVESVPTWVGVKESSEGTDSSLPYAFGAAGLAAIAVGAYVIIRKRRDFNADQ